MSHDPDPIALVLSGGGARAAYQVGVLAALTERVPSFRPAILTGVSAGAINTLYLAARRGEFAAAVAGLAERWRALTVDRVLRVRPLRLGRAALRALLGRPLSDRPLHGLLDTAPLHEFLTASIDPAGVDDNIDARRLHAVALTATAYGTGFTVTFVHGAPGIAAWSRARRVALPVRLGIEHVMASTAIPLLFPAVAIGNEFYGDGSVRLTAPLAPAIHLGARSVIAIGLRAAGADAPATAAPTYPSAAEAMGLVLHSIFLDALDADAERLERVNRLLAALPAGAAAPEGLHPVRLLVLRPSADLAGLAAGQVPALPRAVRLVVERLGGRQAGAKGFISYLLFDPVYTARLMSLGYDDVGREWGRVEAFLAGA